MNYQNESFASFKPNCFNFNIEWKILYKIKILLNDLFQNKDKKLNCFYKIYNKIFNVQVI